MTSEELVSRILYRDALMLVIDKPAGLPVHPGHGGGETLADHLDALRFGLPARPQVVHRLDRETSGCLALGRHPNALRRLNALFSERRVEKLYWAWVEGGPDGESGTIDLGIAPVSRQTPWRMKADANGAQAVTEWRALAREEGRTLLALSPLTGRTHQLRVHCAAMGWPIAGDTAYGRARRGDGSRLLLHARALTIPLYPKKPAIHVEAPIPEGFPPPPAG